MQLGKEWYENIIDFILQTFKKVFGDEVAFVKKYVAIEHMGYFTIQYRYLSLEYDLIFENDRNVFVINIYDCEGAKNTLYRIEKFKNELSIENIKDAIQKLKMVLEKNEMCFYITKNDKLYRKFNGEYKRIKNLNELR